MTAITVLDRGFVRFVEDWGKGDAGEAEAGIIEAARQSTQGSFRGWETDEKLLSYLFNNRPPHSSPFEFAGMVIEVRAPIFVFREWHRHRTQWYNEMSARYAPLPDVNYIPSVERLMMNASTVNKQAGVIKGAVEMTPEMADLMRRELAVAYTNDETFYQRWLKLGAPKEVARVKLPVGRYSQMRAGASLRNWLAFLTLRADPNAQWEIQQYAHAVGAIISERFPRVWNLYHLAKESAVSQENELKALRETAKKWETVLRMAKECGHAENIRSQILLDTAE